MEFKETQLESILEINPTTSLKKGTIAKKIAMEHLDGYVKKIQGYEITEFKSGSKFKNGDTLVARITPCLENGKIAYVDILDDDEIAFGSTEFFVVRAKEGKSDPQFIYYLMCSPEVRDITIQSMTGTSGRQRAQKESILGYKLKVPDIDTQSRIGNVLSLFDKKIEANKEMIKTLEQLSQTLFKHWFIDFEFPNEQGQPYKSSGGEMVESELGEIPKEFKIEKLDEIADIKGGKRLPKGEIVQEEKTPFPYLRVKDFTSTKRLDINNVGYITESAYEKIKNYIIHDSDIFISIAGTIGLVVTIPKAFSGANLTENAAKITVHKEMYKYFIFLFLKSSYGNEQIVSSTVGSTQPKLPLYAIKNIQFVFPKIEILLKFSSIIKSLFEKIEELETENQKLTQLRDTLLPKLLSGEIEIPDELEVK